MKVADAAFIAHAMYSQFQLFLYHLLVMDLVAILVVCQADLAVLEAHEVQDVAEVVDLVDQREVQDHRRDYNLAKMDNWYYLLLRSQV